MEGNIIEKVIKLENPLPKILNPALANYDAKSIFQYDYFYTVNKEAIYCIAILVLDNIVERVRIEWKVWVKMNVPDFQKVMSGEFRENKFVKGQIVDDILCYQNTNKLEIEVEFIMGDEITYPIISFKNKNSTLAKEWFNGMTKQKFECISSHFEG